MRQLALCNWGKRENKRKTYGAEMGLKRRFGLLTNHEGHQKANGQETQAGPYGCRQGALRLLESAHSSTAEVWLDGIWERHKYLKQ